MKKLKFKSKQEALRALEEAFLNLDYEVTENDLLYEDGYYIAMVPEWYFNELNSN